MITYICDTHRDYPKRISANNLFYTEYKDSRPFFFHDILFKESISNCSELLVPSSQAVPTVSLVPSIEYFKDIYSYITNDYVLNSIFFEYCDYYIKYIEDEDINFAMLPINPYGPTGLGGLGLFTEWGPNHVADPIVITYDNTRQIYQVLVIEIKDAFCIYSLPSGKPDTNKSISTTLTQELKDKTNIILDTKSSQFIYSGYVNDARNTDNAWLETCVYLFNINQSQRLILLNVISSENSSISTKLIDIDDENEIYKNLYTNHKEFIQMSLNYIFKN